MRIFVVDDEAPIVQLCIKLLEQDGHLARGFVRGEDLLADLGPPAPDLLVVDYKMPDLNGFEVIRRARRRYPRLRVLMITGHGTREVLAEAEALGVDKVLLKPFTPKELKEVVAGLGRG